MQFRYEIPGPRVTGSSLGTRTDSDILTHSRSLFDDRLGGRTGPDVTTEERLRPAGITGYPAVREERLGVTHAERLDPPRRPCEANLISQGRCRYSTRKTSQDYLPADSRHRKSGNACQGCR